MGKPEIEAGDMIMNNPTRMSPLTAFFLGLFGVGGVGIACLTAVVLSGMRIIDDKAASILSIAEGTIGDLPRLVESIQPIMQTVLNDRRAPEYAAHVEVTADFTPARSGGFVPSLTIKNTGDKVISLLAIRVAALDERKVAVREWTEVVATPLALEDEWRGPIMPGATRHVVLSGRMGGDDKFPTNLVGTVEISDVRIWSPEAPAIRSALAIP